MGLPYLGGALLDNRFELMLARLEHSQPRSIDRPSDAEEQQHGGRAEQIGLPKRRHHRDRQIHFMRAEHAAAVAALYVQQVTARFKIRETRYAMSCIDVDPTFIVALEPVTIAIAFGRRIVERSELDTELFFAGYKAQAFRSRRARGAVDLHHADR